MHWLINGLVQKMLGLPGGEALNFQLQARLGSLRAHHFVDVAHDCGFDPVLDPTIVREERMPQLRAMPLVPQFGGGPGAPAGGAA